MSEIILYGMLAIAIIYIPAIIGFLISDWLDKRKKHDLKDA